MSEIIVKTPITDPEHETIGHIFRSVDGHLYYCDSWQSNWGFWMRRTDCPPDHLDDQDSEYRRNVSERAIGRTFHKVRK